MNVKKKIALTLLLCSIWSIAPLPQPLFYDPTWFIKPPRFERAWLFTGNIMVRGGITHQGFETSHKKTDALNIYGAENIRLLAQGVPAAQLGPDTFLNTLYTSIPEDNSFGTINWFGHFSLRETVFQVVQNFNHGLFAQIVVPVRHWRFYNVSFSDNSTPETAGDINYQQWQELSNNLLSILTEYDIFIGPLKKTHVGDVQLLVGWTENNESFEYIDYWDYSLTSGVFARTSTRINPDFPFFLSSGFGHHLCVPLSVNTAVGMYNWLTFGFHLTGYFFKNSRQVLGIKTAQDQNGWIKLARETVDIDKGNIFELGGYLSADHFIHGISSTFGFSYAKELESTLRVVTNSNLYDPAIVNSDIRLQGWSMVIMHWYFELDLATRSHPTRPQIALTVDVPMHAVLAFKTQMIGLNVQCNWEW